MIVDGFKYIKKHKYLLFLIVPAFIFHMLMIMPNGSYRCSDDGCGMYFYGVHVHDSIWHLALAAVSFQEIPFVSPIYSGALLSGYNILIDIVLFLFMKLGIPHVFVFFKIFPLIWFILFTLFIIKIGNKLKKSSLFVFLLLYFSYFGGSFTYMVTLYHQKTIVGATGLSAMQSGLMMTNLQLAFSFVLLILQLIIVFKKKWNTKIIIFLSIITAFQIGLKFYGGVISVFIFSLFLAEYLIRYKDFRKVFIFGLIFSVMQIFSLIVFYNPLATLDSGSVFIFSPFAIVHYVIESPDFFYLPDLVLQRYHLYSVNPFSPRLLAIEMFSVLLFIFFNFGVRFFGLLYYFSNSIIRRKFTRFDIYLYLIILFSTLITILFIQRGSWWNTIQFFYYGIFLANIFGAFLAYDLFKSKKLLSIFIGIILLIAAVPNNYEIVKGLTELKGAHISDNELSALNHLKKKPDGVVFSAFHIIDQKSKSSFSDTSYVSAFTGKQEFINNATQLELMSIDYKNRYEKVKSLDCSFLNNIDYIYYDKNYSNMFFVNCVKELRSFKETFSNERIRIFERFTPLYKKE